MLCSELIKHLAVQIAAEGDTEVLIIGSRMGVKFGVSGVVVGSLGCGGPEFLIEADEGQVDAPKE